MFHIIWYIVVGFVVGLLARAILPGADHMGLVATTAVGLVGSSSAASSATGSASRRRAPATAPASTSCRRPRGASDAVWPVEAPRSPAQTSRA